MIFLHLDLSSVMIFTPRCVLLVEYKCTQVHISILVVTRAHLFYIFYTLVHTAFVGSLFSTQKDIDRATVKNAIPLKKLQVSLHLCLTSLYVCLCVCVFLPQLRGVWSGMSVDCTQRAMSVHCSHRKSLPCTYCSFSRKTWQC